MASIQNSEGKTLNVEYVGDLYIWEVRDVAGVRAWGVTPSRGDVIDSARSHLTETRA